MMKMRSIYQVVIISSFLLSFALAPATLVFAEKDYGKSFDKEGWEEKVNKMHDELGLTGDQRQALKAHKEKHRSEMKAIKEQLNLKQDALRQEMQKDDFDSGRVRMFNDEIKRLHNDMADHRLEGILEVREILTPEQFSKFQEMKDSRRGERKEKREERGEKFKERLKEHTRDRDNE